MHPLLVVILIESVIVTAGTLLALWGLTHPAEPLERG